VEHSLLFQVLSQSSESDLLIVMSLYESMVAFFGNEGVQLGIAVTGVFGITVGYEVVRSKRGLSGRRNQYTSAATMFIFLFLLAVGWVHQPFGGKDEPSIALTAGAGMQLFAFILLFLAPREDGADQRKEPRRAPADFGFLMIYALVARLWCTMKYDGYLPSDETGDGCIQTLEALAMQVAVVGLARQAIGFEECKRFLGGLAVAWVCALVCYGSLDWRPHVDRLYASTQYSELIAWLFMLDFARKATKNGTVGGMYVLPSFLNACCRAFFWVCAYSEMIPKTPIRLMAWFPAMIVAVQVLMAGVILSTGVLKDRRVLNLLPSIISDAV